MDLQRAEAFLQRFFDFFVDFVMFSVAVAVPMTPRPEVEALVPITPTSRHLPIQLLAVERPENSPLSSVGPLR